MEEEHKALLTTLLSPSADAVGTQCLFSDGGSLGQIKAKKQVRVHLHIPVPVPEGILWYPTLKCGICIPCVNHTCTYMYVCVHNGHVHVDVLVQMNTGHWYVVLEHFCSVYSGTVLIRTPREVSSFQWVNNTYLYEVGTWSSVLIREVSLIQGYPLRGGPLYTVLYKCFFCAMPPGRVCPANVHNPLLSNRLCGGERAPAVPEECAVFGEGQVRHTGSPPHPL